MLIEEGWLCDGRSPTVCDAWGNGRLTREIGEECDDGNLIDGDGCSHDMLIEPPLWGTSEWICDGRSPTTCDRWGNGILSPNIDEECDDGNF